jgi:chemotaxis protein methyltransferase CheR
MFRDPLFYKMVREEVIPELASYPVIRIWHAGCSTGEEVYSMAILLKEAGLLERSIIYATDINRQVLDQAKSGIFDLSHMQEYSTNYNNSGGLRDFSSYYTARYGKAIFNEELNARMVFSPHNLAQDQSFNEFNLIVCRNVLIYFNQSLQNKVIDLFLNSLSSFGILTLGSKEDIQFKTSANQFEIINRKQKAWRKKK